MRGNGFLLQKLAVIIFSFHICPHGSGSFHYAHKALGYIRGKTKTRIPKSFPRDFYGPILWYAIRLSFIRLR